MKKTLLLAAILALFAAPCLAAATSAADALHSPQKGSAERKQILDALRIPVEKAIGQPVSFVVQTLNVHSDFAFIQAKPQKPDGSAIDYSKTQFAGAIEAGYFDNQVVALLKLEGGKWLVLEYTIGATDFSAPNWIEQYRAPGDLLSV